MCVYNKYIIISNTYPGITNIIHYFFSTLKYLLPVKVQFFIHTHTHIYCFPLWTCTLRIICYCCVRLFLLHVSVVLWLQPSWASLFTCGRFCPPEQCGFVCHDFLVSPLTHEQFVPKTVLRCKCRKFVLKINKVQI